MKPRLAAGKPRLGRAPSDERARDAERDATQPWRAWYKTARWRKLARACYARDEYRCRRTGELLVGKHPAANSPVANHRTPHHGDPTLFWDPDNIETVSKRVHDGDIQRAERRGFA